MSDDEEDGQLHIDESPPLDEPTSSEDKSVAKAEDVGKEDGELDDEDDTDSEKEKMLQIDEEESTSSKDDPKEKEKTPEAEKPTPKKSTESSSEMRPPQSTEKPRKRKESMENHRKSGLDAIDGTPSTPQRSSKRQSSQMAQSLISACFHDDDIVSVPPMSIGTTPTSAAKRQKLSSVTAPSPLKEGTSAANGTGGQTRDASTSVITTRSLDTAGLVSNDNIMDTPPGTTRLVELTVMYRTRSAVAFKVNGTEVLGFFGTGLPEFPRESNGPGTSGSGGKKKEDSKDGRSSSASNNGRSTRGSSVVDNKSEKGRDKGKRRKDELADEDVDEESMHGVDEAKGKLELMEVDLDQLHDCSFPDCHKRFRQSAELEYHISKNHKNRVLMYESICTQTDLSMNVGKVDVAIETDEGMQNMPVLEMEAAEVPSKTGLVYEDLSDDEPPPAELAIKAPPQTPQSSATAALQGLVQATASIGQPTPSALQMQQRSANSTPIVARMNPSMMAQSMEKRKQQMQQPQKSAFSPRASQPPSSIAGSVMMPTSSAPQMIPLQSFFPGGYQPMPPGMMMNHPLFQHQQQQLHQQQLQQAISRTPSRQMPDAHKIHELKAKENEQRQRQAAATPKTSTPGNATPQRQFVHPHMMQGTPTTIQQQQQQNQANAFQMHQQLQMLRNPMLQPEMLAAMMMNCMPGQAAFPGTPQPPPPK